MNKMAMGECSGNLKDCGKSNGIMSNHGQTIIEFALLAVVLFVVIFGIMEFAFVLYNKVVVTNASREAARSGTLFRVDDSFQYAPLGEPEIKSIVNDYLQNGLITFGQPFDSDNVIVTWDSAPISGNKLSVSVNFEHKFLVLSKLAGFGDGTLDLKSTSIMRME